MVKDARDIVKGVCTLAELPFTTDGAVDYNAFEKLVDFLAGTGADGVGLWGIVAEFFKVNDYERDALTAIFLNTLRGRKPYSLISVTDWSTDVAVKRAQQYERMGANTLMLLPPFYFEPGVDGIREHMKRVLEAVDIPVLIQYAPQLTNAYIPDDELVDMASSHPNAAFKIEYKPDTTAYTKKFLDLKPDMAILAGYAGLELISQYDIGVVGVMPSCSFTEVYVDMHAKYMSGDFAGARAIYDKLSKYISEWLVSTQSLLTVEKEILKRRELISCSYCRLPDYKLTKVNYAQIDQFMAEFAKYLT